MKAADKRMKSRDRHIEREAYWSNGPVSLSFNVSIGQFLIPHLSFISDRS
jgi:hypothetical protein